MECLEDNGKGTCAGEVQYRQAMSPTGKQFPRCEKHYRDRLTEQERIVRTYGGKFFYG